MESYWFSESRRRFQQFVNSDVTDIESFKALHLWLEEVSKHTTHPDAVLVLIANKIDKRAEDNCVSKIDGQDFATEHSMLFVETSAKTNEGVDQAFSELVAKVDRQFRVRKHFV